jgi:hypothetical protein
LALPEFEGARKSGARILEIGVWRRALMATEDTVGSDRESQADVEAVLAETGRTMDQVRRWRREGLLADIVQDRQAYRGSVVLYPKGTCAQIRAASVLFKEKNRVEYVGLRLWRQGFPVDEKHWRSRLQRQGRMLDRVIPLIMGLVQRFDREEKAETVYDQAARRLEPTDDIILSRIKGRSNSKSLPTVLRVIGDVGTGEFDGFEALIAGEEQTSDKAFTIRAFDLTNAGSHSILGKKLNLIEVLPSGLKNVSAAISMGNFERVANAPAEEIARARDDGKNGLAIARDLYEANRWIYGDGAFGLRLAAWIARKAPDVLLDTMTLLMFRLREVPGAIKPSDEIAEMAKQSRDVCMRSKELEGLWKKDPRFSEILNPNRIKLAFADKVTVARWQRELNAITVEGAAKSPTGSIDDGQEVGKGR